MNKKEILDFLNTHPVVYLATVEDGKPRVRGMGLYRADENGIILQTSTPKDLQKQLERNPEVEMCCFSPEEFKQVRVSGQMEQIDDEAMRKEVIEKRPFLKPLVDNQGLRVITLWRLKQGKALVWTMDSNFAPKSYVEL